MDFELSEEHKMFQRAIRDFAQKELAPLVEETEEQEKYPVEAFRKLGALGYLCPRYPIEYGGGGLGKTGDCILVEEVARVSVGIAAGIMVQSGIATSSIDEHGSEHLKQKYLVPAIKGEMIACFGLTEPNAGSDAAAIETTAVRDSDGYILNGTKIFITNSPIGDFVTTAAYTDKSKGARGGVSLFVLQTNTPGFFVRKLEKWAFRSSETGEITLDNCRVPKENLIGEEGRGFGYLMEALAGGRLSHGARSLGAAEAAFEAALTYAQQRVQFGQPIAKFQDVQFKLARMAMEIEAARWLMYRAAWLYDQRLPCLKEAYMTKLFNSEVAHRVANHALQINSGYGFVIESEIGRIFRDSRLFLITEGTSEVQLMVIARQLGLR
jgi:hypothetical protein